MKIFYTDASASKKRTFCLVTDSEGSYLCHQNCNYIKKKSFLAELLGIITVIKNAYILDPTERVVIFTDCISSADLLTRDTCSKKQEKNQLLLLGRTLLQDNKNIDVIWIPRKSNLAGRLITRYQRTKRKHGITRKLSKKYAFAA
ncbi:hypothetical protein LCGC14_1987660 [marine sediment metagenome]|uniref:RNase H type-1 domain-containing protein n=1 Tax=marine sediment metagenome TaxID=412755 RepID=A0A0F9HKC2_9ZZZZ